MSHRVADTRFKADRGNAFYVAADSKKRANVVVREIQPGLLCWHECARSGFFTGRNRMKIVAVTACPTGIAHTYMAAEQLEKAARKLGYQIRIEVQAAAGTENMLTQAEVNQADVVVIASDVPVENEERFAQSPNVARVPMHIALKDAAAILAQFERSVLHGA